MLSKKHLLLLIFTASAWALENDTICHKDALSQTEQFLYFTVGSLSCFEFTFQGQARLTNWSWTIGNGNSSMDPSNAVRFYDSSRKFISKISFSHLPQQITFDHSKNSSIFIYVNITSGELITYINDATPSQPLNGNHIMYTSNGNSNATMITYPEDGYLKGVHVHYTLAGSSVCIENISIPTRANCTSSYMRLIAADASIDRRLCGLVVQEYKPKNECVNSWEFNFSPIQIEFYTEDLSGFSSKYAGVRVKVDETPITTTTAMLTTTTPIPTKTKTTMPIKTTTVPTTTSTTTTTKPPTTTTPMKTTPTSTTTTASNTTPTPTTTSTTPTPAPDSNSTSSTSGVVSNYPDHCYHFWLLLAILTHFGPHR